VAESLETKVEVIGVQLAAIKTAVDAFGPTARQVIEASTNVEAQSRELRDLRDDLHAAEGRFEKQVARAETACSNLAAKIDQYSVARTTSRATIIVGCLGAAGTLLAIILPKLLG
jgi:phage shock protein A